MRTVPTSWLSAMVVFSAIWNPLCAIAESSTIPPRSSLARSPLACQPSYSQMQIIPWLDTTKGHTRTTLVAPRIQDERVPARYTTRQPRIFLSQPLTPTLDGTGGTRPRPFIGPRPEHQKPVRRQGTDLASASPPASTFPLSSYYPPALGMSAILQHRENEYDRMNDASHEILHGGN